MGGVGLEVNELSIEQASLLQRFGHARFVTEENEADIVNSLLENTFYDACVKHSHIVAKCGDLTIDGVNEDTIGFFIAKFVKGQ